MYDYILITIKRQDSNFSWTFYGIKNFTVDVVVLKCYNYRSNKPGLKI